MRILRYREKSLPAHYCCATFLVVTITCLLACRSVKETTGDVFNLRFSTVSVPRDAHTLCLSTFKEEIERSTNGKIKVEIFHSGQLFTQEAEQLAVRRGTVDMVYSGPSWLGEHVPYVSMFTMAYLFRDYEHMTAVLNGPIGKRVFEDVAQKVGVRPLGAFYLGTRELNLRDIGRIVQHPQDLSGIKLRMPNSMCWLFLGEALGASPANISFTELYMALKSGTVDGHDNPLPTSKNARLYEVTSQIVLTDHYVHPAWPSINEDVWQRMDQDLQEKMYDAIDKARERCDTINLRAETELLTFFQSQGITITIPDRQQFAGHAREKYFKDHPLVQFWDMELYEQVLETGK